MASSSSKHQAILTWPLLWVLALYLSDILVFLTPLPITYAFMMNGSQAWKKLVIPAGLGVSGLYLLLTPYLSGWYQAYPYSQLLLSLPFANLYPQSSYIIVVLVGILYFSFFSILGLIIGRSLREKANPLFILSGLSLLTAFVVVGFMSLSFSAEGVSLTAGVETYYAQAISDFILQQKNGNLPLEQLVYLEESRADILKFCLYLSPSFLFSGIFLVGLVNLIVSRKLFFKFLYPTKIYSLSTFELPFISVWLFIGSLAGVLFNIYFFNSSLIEFLSVNILAILVFFYYLQGLNIISFYLFIKRVGPLFRLSIFLIFILFFQALGIFVVSLGFFDAWFDFRKLHKKPEKPEETEKVV